MARKTLEQLIAADEARLAERKAKAAAKAEADAKKADEKKETERTRLTAQAEKLVTSIEADTKKLEEINLKLVALDSDFTEIGTEPEFVELELEEV